MHKSPTYIGIFCADNDSSKKLKSYARQCLQEVLGQVNSLYIQQDYNKFNDTFHPPKDNYHITSLFIGGNQAALKQKGQQILKNFKHGINVDIKCDVCVYVPGNIIVAYTPQLNGIQCDNAHPHVTLFLGGDTKAVQSNDVLQYLHKQLPNVCKQEFSVKQLKTKFKGKSIFVIKKSIKVPGVTGDNFKNGSWKK